MDAKDMVDRLEDGCSPLKVSIEKWMDVRNALEDAKCEHEGMKILEDQALISDNCACCYTYRTGSGNLVRCESNRGRCPIAEKTQRHLCAGTPYDVLNGKSDEYESIEEIRTDVKAELDFLKSLGETKKATKVVQRNVKSGQVYRAKFSDTNERNGHLFLVVQNAGIGNRLRAVDLNDSTLWYGRQDDNEIKSKFRSNSYEYVGEFKDGRVVYDIPDELEVGQVYRFIDKSGESGHDGHTYKVEATGGVYNRYRLRNQSYGTNRAVASSLSGVREKMGEEDNGAYYELLYIVRSD